MVLTSIKYPCELYRLFLKGSRDVMVLARIEHQLTVCKLF